MLYVLCYIRLAPSRSRPIPTLLLPSVELSDVSDYYIDIGYIDILAYHSVPSLGKKVHPATFGKIKIG